MSEELQKPPVVDFDALLAPISEENPSGENQRYSGLYDEISEARRADDVLSQGDWQTEVKTANHRKVLDLASQALTAKSKDIQVAAWFCEALTYQHGFPGLRDGLKVLAALQETFWETAFPEIDEGDMEGRANAIAWVDTQCAFAIKKIPITQGAGYTYFDWEDAKRFTLPDNFDSLAHEDQERLKSEAARAESEGRVNGEAWKAARTQTRRQFCEETNFAVEECWAAYKELNRVIEEKYDRNQAPSMPELNKALDAVHTQVQKILADKRAEEPDPADDAEYANGEASDGSAPARGGGGGGPISGRADALKKLSQIATFFQRTEPHSPVAYLVQRAVRWGNMPLNSWLQDVIKDESVLDQIRETLGVNTDGSNEFDSGYGGSDSSTDQPSNEDW